MKKFHLKYFAAAFFIIIYLFKGTVSIVHILWDTEKERLWIAILMDTEENEKRNAGENLDAETKELYHHHNYLINLNIPVIVITTAKKHSPATVFMPFADLSIPTPPPELS